MTVARHLVMLGRVQGVWYRGWAVETARSLGLTGWVRNCRNGTVEALVQGDEEAVDRFIELASAGPSHANVDRIEIAEVEPDGTLGQFSQRVTV